MTVKRENSDQPIFDSGNTKKDICKRAGSQHLIFSPCPSGSIPRCESPALIPPRLIESYCAGCGLLIAASPLRKILKVMETLHRARCISIIPRRKRARAE
jgi:hypothetical protein